MTHEMWNIWASQDRAETPNDVFFFQIKSQIYQFIRKCRIFVRAYLSLWMIESN